MVDDARLLCVLLWPVRPAVVDDARQDAQKSSITDHSRTHRSLAPTTASVRPAVVGDARLLCVLLWSVLDFCASTTASVRPAVVGDARLLCVLLWSMLDFCVSCCGR